MSTDTGGTSSATRREFLVRTSAGAAVVAGGSVLAAPIVPAAEAGTTGRAIALTHVTVIDATGARPRPDTTVILRGERITALGRSAEVPIPRDAKVIDLTGKFLVPGLCDMHVHSRAVDVDLPLCIAKGVTTVGEMRGQPSHYEWRDRIQNGTLLGPRSVTAGQLIDGAP